MFQNTCNMSEGTAKDRSCCELGPGGKWKDSRRETLAQLNDEPAFAASPLRRGSLRLSESSLACRAEARPKGERRLVAQICPRWNPLTSWMRQIEDFQRAA
jgi:hypothetical protein